MIIGILKEERKGETRVAAVPDTVKKYTAAGFEVLVEKEAGQSAGFPDEFYRVAGGNIVSREKILRQADILIKIWCLPKKDFSLLHAGQILMADMETYHHPEYAQSLSALGVDVLALEKMPRISRAQGMDILSSQSNLAGYKAALLAVDLLNRGTALMMTPAGASDMALISADIGVHSPSLVVMQIFRMLMAASIFPQICYQIAKLF